MKISQCIAPRIHVNPPENSPAAHTLPQAPSRWLNDMYYQYYDDIIHELGILEWTFKFYDFQMIYIRKENVINSDFEPLYIMSIPGVCLG